MLGQSIIDFNLPYQPSQSHWKYVKEYGLPTLNHWQDLSWTFFCAQHCINAWCNYNPGPHINMYCVCMWNEGWSLPELSVYAFTNCKKQFPKHKLKLNSFSKFYELLHFWEYFSIPPWASMSRHLSQWPPDGRWPVWAARLLVLMPWDSSPWSPSIPLRDPSDLKENGPSLSKTGAVSSASFR